MQAMDTIICYQSFMHQLHIDFLLVNYASYYTSAKQVFYGVFI